MELQTAVATVRDEASPFGDRSLEPKAALALVVLAPGFDAGAPEPGLDRGARRSRAVMREWPTGGFGTEPAPTFGTPVAQKDSIQALTVPVELVDRGDVVAIGHRFYRVDSIPRTHPHHEFPRIVLRCLETAAHAAIEFQDSDELVSVLRFPTGLRWPNEVALEEG